MLHVTSSFSNVTVLNIHCQWQLNLQRFPQNQPGESEVFYDCILGHFGDF